MVVLVPFLGAMIGSIGGFFLGDIAQINVDGASSDLRIVTTLVGTLVGYFAAQFVARGLVQE